MSKINHWGLKYKEEIVEVLSVDVEPAIEDFCAYQTLIEDSDLANHNYTIVPVEVKELKE